MSPGTWAHAAPVEPALIITGSSAAEEVAR